MIENLEEEAWKLMQIFRKITPVLVVRKLNINFDLAKKICDKLAFRQHLEMRKYVKDQTM